jgi:hypothetical protein
VRTPRIAYLLLGLVLWAQVDDVWGVCSSPSPSVATDDDEYLPADSQCHGHSTAFLKPTAAGLKLRTSDFLFVQRSVPYRSHHFARPCNSLALYDFISLQF